MTYRDLLTFATSIKPGDHETARSWLRELVITLRDEKLNSNERHYLYRLRRVWERRARGEDPRWELVGVRAGALPRVLTTILPDTDGYPGTEPIEEYDPRYSLEEVMPSAPPQLEPESLRPESSTKTGESVAQGEPVATPPAPPVAPPPKSTLADILGKY